MPPATIFAPMGRTSEHEIRVRHPETDQMGGVCHAHSLVYMAVGRTRRTEGPVLGRTAIPAAVRLPR